TLFIKSVDNPATYYSTIECALGQHMVYNPHATYPHIGAHDVSNIIFENLAFKYGGAYAFKFQRVHHIRVQNCDMEWMGGAEVDGQARTRYGNGIEFFGLAFYCQANGNKMNQIYDSGISYQAINSPAAAIGISFMNNSLLKCGLAGYELWLRSDKGQLTNISFCNNTLMDIGKGWGGEANQRKTNAYWGFAFLLDSTYCPTQSLSILGNIVINREKYAVFVNEKEHILPRKEFEIIALLASKPHKVFTREEIFQSIWGNSVVGDRTIDVHIRRIREKLNIDNITTIKGIGYKFEI
ncbi:MAG TPA: winged helix-turn-helix domain-containing protein, partial [Bacteroidales bacterium]|nr:winged helix-turn-helix domain-containing protein [Bacteroidales bacterium]